MKKQAAMLAGIALLLPCLFARVDEVVADTGDGWKGKLQSGDRSDRR